MDRSPFIDDPRDLLAHHVALAVDSPLEEVCAMHIGAALHHAEIATGSGLTLRSPSKSAADEADERPQRAIKRAILAALVFLPIAATGMAVAGIVLLRS